MTVRTVLTWPDPGLKKVATPVEEIDAEIINIAQDMRDTMCVEFGAGLAATQVGLSHSVVVLKSSFHTDPSLRNDPIVDDCIVLVNPSIETLDEKVFRWSESCLSVPGIEETVERHCNIRLTYTDLTKISHTIEINNELAGLVQHEVDHLLGKLFIDRLKRAHRRRALNTLGASIHSANLTRLKEERRLKREEKDPEESKPGFRSKVTLKSAQRRKVAKNFGKNKRRRKK
tara:strand:+ start:1754 stop:2443 length:690 start_codon:yes stop_codon:yes gene_type:complete